MWFVRNDLCGESWHGKGMQLTQWGKFKRGTSCGICGEGDEPALLCNIVIVDVVTSWVLDRIGVEEKWNCCLWCEFLCGDGIGSAVVVATLVVDVVPKVL